MGRRLTFSGEMTYVRVDRLLGGGTSSAREAMYGLDISVYLYSAGTVKVSFDLFPILGVRS